MVHGRVIIGENVRTDLRCVTIDAITVGLDRGNFFGTFTKKDIQEVGTFYMRSNQATFDALVPFLEGCFSHLRVFLPEQSALGSSAGGLVFINGGIESIIRVIGDIIDHLVAAEAINPKTDDPVMMVVLSSWYTSLIMRCSAIASAWFEVEALAQEERLLR